uniref:TSPO associated protein 1 n=1 Tax=Macrostomum lignano TaxID=282301 RepID=A0A1I8FEW9_9PLAT
QPDAELQQQLGRLRHLEPEDKSELGLLRAPGSNNEHKQQKEWLQKENTKLRDHFETLVAARLRERDAETSRLTERLATAERQLQESRQEAGQTADRLNARLAELSARAERLEARTRPLRRRRSGSGTPSWTSCGRRRAAEGESGRTKLAELTKEKDSLLTLSMERGRLCEEKQRELKAARERQEVAERRLPRTARPLQPGHRGGELRRGGEEASSRLGVSSARSGRPFARNSPPTKCTLAQPGPLHKYTCEDSAKPNCCQEGDLSTCCDYDPTQRTILQQLAIWGLLLATMAGLIIIYLCCFPVPEQQRHGDSPAGRAGESRLLPFLAPLLSVLAPLVLAPLVLAPLLCWRLWCWRLWCWRCVWRLWCWRLWCWRSGAGASGCWRLVLAPLVLAPLVLGLWCWRL